MQQLAEEWMASHQTVSTSETRMSRPMLVNVCMRAIFWRPCHMHHPCLRLHWRSWLREASKDVKQDSIQTSASAAEHAHDYGTWRALPATVGHSSLHMGNTYTYAIAFSQPRPQQMLACMDPKTKLK